MPYQHCPSCRLVVHLAAGEPGGAPCPRCGAALGDRPRSLFASPPPVAGGRSRHERRLTPEAVRPVMSLRGGRFRREGRPVSGR